MRQRLFATISLERRLNPLDEIIALAIVLVVRMVPKPPLALDGPAGMEIAPPHDFITVHDLLKSTFSD